MWILRTVIFKLQCTMLLKGCLYRLNIGWIVTHRVFWLLKVPFLPVVVTQLVSPAAAANLDPRPWQDVSTHPSSERVYVTLVSYFVDFLHLAPLLSVHGETYAWVAPGWLAAGPLPSLLPVRQHILSCACLTLGHRTICHALATRSNTVGIALSRLGIRRSLRCWPNQF